MTRLTEVVKYVIVVPANDEEENRRNAEHYNTPGERARLRETRQIISSDRYCRSGYIALH